MKAVLSVLILLPFWIKSQPLFTLLAPGKTGIDFQNKIVETSEQNVLGYEYFYNGGGVAVGDLNNDGLPDIVFTANMEQPKIYFNKGGLSFEDVTFKSKVQATGWKTGVTMADVNGDGWLDIYISRSGKGEEDSRSNLLFVNQKNGSFREMSAAYGVDDKGQSTHAAFFDYDNDGDLDLFILNHSVKKYKNFDVAFMKSARDSLAGDKLYRNDGKRFTNVTGQAGIKGNPINYGLGIAVADFNADGWTDIYVTNDYDEEDYLYINQKNGTFTDLLPSLMGHVSKFSMGCDVADVNNDAMTDLLTLDMLPEDNRRQKLLKGPDGYDFFQMLISNGYYYQYMRNMLQLATNNNGQIQFSEIGQMAGISNTDWSWSALFGDYDLDGWQDLFITNGYMRDYTNLDFLKFAAPEAIRKAREAGSEPDFLEIVKKMPSSDVKNYLYRNTGKLGFENKSKDWGMDAVSLSNGAAYGDLDNDGDWDLVVNNINQPAFIWQNHAEDLKNNYVKIKFNGSGNNPFGIGAKVIVSAADGFEQLQEMQMVHGYQSSVEPCLIFGVGKRNSVTIKVVWPNGKLQVLTQQPVNKLITVEEKNTTGNYRKEEEKKMLFSELVENDFTFVHREDDFNDFKREPLLPHQFSKNGPALAAGDVNGDGKTDLYIGGATGQAGVIYLNNGNGKFIETKNADFAAHNYFEDVEALFADLDNDKDLDLYVVSGGNKEEFQDRIYWNDGKGNFSFIPDGIPVTNSSGGTVVVFDMDNDGDLDIFRGGQVLGGSYPVAPRSYLFENDHANFKDVTPDFLKNIGMVNTARVADVNKDGINDLIIAGEYMPVMILSGELKSPFFRKEQQQVIANSTGWWNCIQVTDIDADGDMDIIAGNHGLNSQMKPTVAEPLTVDAADIDNNGSVDAIISYYIQGKSYPIATRDEIADQVPSLKTKFPSYQAYCDATIKDIMPKEKLETATHLKAEEFRSGIFVNDGKQFQFKPFENEAQAFPVRDFLVEDFNKDGMKDILLIGNNYAVRAQSERYDAGKGLVLAQQKDKSFTILHHDGIQANKDPRKITLIENQIIIANNNDKIQVYRIN